MYRVSSNAVYMYRVSSNAVNMYRMSSNAVYMYRVNFDTTIVTAFTGCPFYCKGYMSKMSYVTVYLYMVSCNTI